MRFPFFSLGSASEHNTLAPARSADENAPDLHYVRGPEVGRLLIFIQQAIISVHQWREQTNPFQMQLGNLQIICIICPDWLLQA
jgi:hypothetical protein